MSTTSSTTWAERTSASTRYASSLIWRYWDAFQERDRRKLRSALSDLSDRELWTSVPRAERSTTSLRTEVLTREASDPANGSDTCQR
jgi:hypothetical protein